MKIYKESSFVPKGYTGMTIWPLGMFTKYKRPPKKLVNHEAIHWEQQKETLLIGFILIYSIQWVVEAVKMLLGGDKKVYRDLCAEKEAYNNDDNLNYLKERKRYNWIKYIFIN